MKYDASAEEDRGKRSFSTDNRVSLYIWSFLYILHIRIFALTKSVYGKVLHSKSACSVRACLLVALVIWDDESSLLIR